MIEILFHCVIDEDKSVELIVVDKCEGCAADALDIAENAFVQLFGSSDRGRVGEGTSWTFI